MNGIEKRGPVGARRRREIIVLSSLLILIGLLLIIFGPGFLGGLLSGMEIQNGGEAGAWISYFTGLGLLMLAVLFLGTRPWVFPREMEMRLSAMERSKALLPERHLAYGPADVHFHHGSEDGHAGRICPECGGLKGQGECRICQEEAPRR